MDNAKNSDCRTLDFVSLANLSFFPQLCFVFWFFPGYDPCFFYLPHPLSSSICLQVIPLRFLKLWSWQSSWTLPSLSLPASKPQRGQAVRSPRWGLDLETAGFGFLLQFYREKAPETWRVEAMQMRAFKVKVTETDSNPYLCDHKAVFYPHTSTFSWARYLY